MSDLIAHFGLAADRHPAAGVPENEAALRPVAPPTAEASTFTASARDEGSRPAEAAASGSTASGPDAAGPMVSMTFEELVLRAIDALAEAEREQNGGHLDPVLAMALRRIELLELAIARALALLPDGAIATRLRELIPGRRVPSDREVLMPEWRDRPPAAPVPLGAAERRAARIALCGERVTAMAESLEASIGRF